MCANEREKRGSVSARLPRYPLITLTDNYSTARANCIFLYKKKYDNYSKKGTRRRGGGGSINGVVKEKSIYGSTQFVDGTPSINDEHCEGVYSFCQHGKQTILLLYYNVITSMFT